MLRKHLIWIELFIMSFVLLACSSSPREARQSSGIPWWGWVLIVLLIVFLALLLIWWQRRRLETTKPPAAEMKPAAEMEAEPHVRLATTPPIAPQPAGGAPDDLTRIEGIGPKISSLLQAAGITTFAQLAATDVSRLKEILAEARLAALADPTTWPEQARLAAAGEWEALRRLQAELKGGRRV